MFVHNIDPNLITIGPFIIRWYGIFYALGFLFVTQYLIKKSKFIKNLNRDKAVDLTSAGMFGGILGARIIHVLMEIEFYMQNPIQIIQIWKGGLSIFGGLLGGVLFGYWYCKKNNIDIVDILDTIAAPFSFFMGLVRIANFINAENWGYPTNLPWAVIFPIDNIPRHPAQLYEAFTMFLLAGLLFYFSKKKDLKKGILTSLFFIFYSIFRFSTEFFRVNTMFFLGLTINQIMTICTAGFGIYILHKIHNTKRSHKRKTTKK